MDYKTSLSRKNNSLKIYWNKNLTAQNGFYWRQQNPKKIDNDLEEAVGKLEESSISYLKAAKIVMDTSVKFVQSTASGSWKLEEPWVQTLDRNGMTKDVK